MASERKAAHRRDAAYKEARKAASADFEEKWPAPGLNGGGQQKPPNRRELMRLYGPKGTARRRTGESEGENGHDRADASHNNDDGSDGGGDNEERNDGGDNDAGDDHQEQ